MRRGKTERHHSERRVLSQNGVQKNITCRNPSHKDAELHRGVSFVLTVDVVDTHDTLGAESEKEEEEEEEEREATNEEKESVKKIGFGRGSKRRCDFCTLRSGVEKT